MAKTYDRMSSHPSAAELKAFMGDIMYYEKAIYDMIEDLVRFKPKTKAELINAVDRWTNKIYYKDAILRYGPIEIWNTKMITEMDSLFYNKPTFNDNINGWDVSRVTNMQDMFYLCTEFNQPLNRWDVSSVTDLSCMFYLCRKFNMPLGDWVVSNVNNMSRMLKGCSSFNQPLGSWDVRTVTDMWYMFEECYSFNQPIGRWVIPRTAVRRQDRGHPYRRLHSR